MCDVEYLWLAARLGYRIREIGISWSDDGDSRLQLVSGNLRNCRELLGIRFGRYALDHALMENSTAVPVAQADR
jgi:hypothetical protein